MERITFPKLDSTVYILCSLSFFGEELEVRYVKSNFHARAIEINCHRYLICSYYDVHFVYRSTVFPVTYLICTYLISKF